MSWYLTHIRQLREEVERSPSSEYQSGCLSILSLLEEAVLEKMWEEGEDDPEEG